MKKSLKFAIFFLLAQFLIFSSAHGAGAKCAAINSCIVYVDQHSEGGGDGSIEAPFQRISDALNFLKANSVYNTIEIAEGIYRNGQGDMMESMPWTITRLGRTINVTGGYYNGFRNQDPISHQTILDAAGSLNIFNFTSTSFKVEGVVFKNVAGNGASALQVHDNNDLGRYIVEIRRTVFQDNQAKVGVPDLDLQLNQRSNGIVENNVFIGANDIGGNAVQIVGQVVFRSNILKSAAVKKDFYCSHGGKIYNNFFHQNNVDILIHLAGGCFFDHNTIHDNVLHAGENTSLMLLGGNNNFARNNLLSVNEVSASKLFQHADKDTSLFDYNGIEFYRMFESDFSLHDHNYVCDPQFPNNGKNAVENLKLGPGSTCIDGGINLAMPTVDYFGHNRQMDGNADSVVFADAGAVEADVNTQSPGLKDLKISSSTFNPLAKNNKVGISFRILRNAQVKVMVVDSHNNEIITLLDHVEREAGTINFDWSGRNNNGVLQPQGNYFIVVSATANEIVQNMMGVVFIDMIAVNDQCAGFVDIPKTAPLCAAVQFVKGRGIFDGYADGTFRADTVINRVETLKVSLIAFGKQLIPSDSSKYGFVDVDPAQWYMKYLPTARALGILTGYNDSTLRPFAQINRVELLKVFFLTAQRHFEDMQISEPPFKDVTDLKSWFVAFVQFVKEHQLMDGNKGNFYPTLGMKRGDVAELMFRYHNAGLGL